MHVGMIGLGKMGGNMAARLLRDGHTVVGTARHKEAIEALEKAGGEGAPDVPALVAALPTPRLVWCMVPAGQATEEVVAEVASRCSAGDVVVDGGNSFYRDSIRRAGTLGLDGIHFLDCGTSGGVWGLTEGYCLMVGGPASGYAIAEPAMKTLAPEGGVRHLGGPGAGHYAKMVHNAIEYGMMQAYAEGFELLEACDYDYDLADLSALWMKGSVVRSWLLELAGRAFTKDPHLAGLTGHVQDSGEGRWTLVESIERAVPMPVLALSLQMRFRSRQEDSFAGKVLAALRNEFGGHAVTKASGS
jgi:6-phosphogluconate dehydrogenase